MAQNGNAADEEKTDISELQFLSVDTGPTGFYYRCGI
jgi:hypothetical protein